MTGVRRIDLAALGASVGEAVLFTLLMLSPFLWGARPAHWLLALGFGIGLGAWIFVRRDRYSEPGPDAHDVRFPDR